MKKQLSLLVVIFLSITLSFSLKADETIRESRDVVAFSELEAGNAMIVEIRKGSAYKLELEGRPQDLEKVITKVDDGELSIRVKPLSSIKTVRVYIIMPELTGVDLSGSIEVNVLDKFEVENFDMDLSGASQFNIELNCSRSLEVETSGASVIRLKGSAKYGDIESSGSSSIHAENFTTEELDAQLSGSTRMDVTVSGRLEVKASGASVLRYSGKPDHVVVNSSGASKVTSLKS